MNGEIVMVNAVNGRQLTGSWGSVAEVRGEKEKEREREREREKKHKGK